MSLIRSAALASVAGLFGTVLAATPAAADRYTESDPVGDMWERRYDGPGSSEQYSAAPEHEELDIHRVVVRHAPRVVFIRVFFRSLTRPGGEESFGFGGFFKVNRAAQPPGGGAWQYMLGFSPGERPAFYIQDSTHFETAGCYSDAESGRGTALRARLDYDRDHLTMVIPRQCLNEAGVLGPDVPPRWVRVSLSAWHGLGLDQPSWGDRLGGPAISVLANVSNSHFTPRVYSSAVRRGRHFRACG